MLNIPSFAIDSNNNLYMWGKNTNGQLGDNSVTNRSIPTKIGTSYEQVFVSSESTFAKKTDGSIWCWGRNSYGELGLNNKINYSSPVQFAPAGVWSKIAYSYQNSLGIKSNGTLWGWGSNNEGTVGDLTRVHRSSPVLISSSTDWADVQVGWLTSYALKNNGTLWIWGIGTYGAWGNGALIDPAIPGIGRSSPVQLGTDTDYSKIAALYPGCIYLKNDGKLYAFGQAGGGIRGDNNSTYPAYNPVQVLGSGYIDIQCANSTAIAKKSDGSFWTWGYTSDGKNTYQGYSSPIQIAPQNFVSNSFSKLNCTNYALYGLAPVPNIPPTPTAPPPTPTPTVTPAPQVGMFVWGNNTNGCLGLNDTVHRSDYTQLGTESEWSNTRVKNISSSDSNHTLAVKYDGTLWGWGDNTYGQLGNGVFTHRSSPVQIGTATNWANAVAGANYSIGVKTDGSLYTWGRNNNGYLGNNQGSVTQPFPFRIGIETNWSTQIEHLSATHHTAAIKTNGTLWTWGYNGQGQLGDNTTVTKSSPVQLAGTNWSQVSTGGSDAAVANSHTVAVKADGTLWAWGYNAAGQLGINATANRSSPVQVPGTTWKYAKASFGGTVALKTNGTMWAWGNSFTNASSSANISSPVQIGTSTGWNTDFRSFSTRYKSAAGIDSNEFYILRSWGDGTDGAQDSNSVTTNLSPNYAGAGLNWKAVYQGYTRAFGMSDAEMSFAGPILDLDPRNYTNGSNTWTDASGFSNNASFTAVSTYGVNNSNTKFVASNAGVFYPMGNRSNAQTDLFAGGFLQFSSTKSFVFNKYTRMFSYEIWARISPSYSYTSTPIFSGPTLNLIQLDNGKIRATIYLENSASATIETTNSFDDFNFHQIVVTNNGNTAKIYVDGVLQASGISGTLRANSGITTVATASPISKLKVWYNYELSASDVSNLYSTWSSIAAYPRFTNKQTFSYTGSLQSWTCPVGVSSVLIGAIGGGGGAAIEYVGSTPNVYANGGLAGTSVCVIPVTAGQTYYIVVGGGGQVSGATYGYGGSGSSGIKVSNKTNTIESGRGGGLSGVFNSNIINYANALLVAGGGGGASILPLTNGAGVDSYQACQGGAGGTENSVGFRGQLRTSTYAGCTSTEQNTGGVINGTSLLPITSSGGVSFENNSGISGGDGKYGQVNISTSYTAYAVTGGGGGGVNGGTSGGIYCSARGVDPALPAAGGSNGQGAGGGATYVKNTATLRYHLGLAGPSSMNGIVYIAY